MHNAIEEAPQQTAGFASTGVSEELIQILSKAGITTPSPIQAQAIPIAKTGADVIGIAQTGTGKTLAFSLPIIEKLQKGPGIAVVLVPTRELALQVEESIRKVTAWIQPRMGTACLIGGASMERQIQDLKRAPRFIIATPGRMQDHLNRRTLRLESTVALVLDEADRMLDMGFAPQIKRILESVPANRQTMLFSATMAPEIAQIAQTYMQNPVRVEVARAGTAHHSIKQELCFISAGQKGELLEKILGKYNGTVLVFTRTKHGASRLSDTLKRDGHDAAEIHSNRSLGQRRQALDGFKSGKYRVLVATDVAARGIDVNNIELVVNYDLPDAAEDYIHRIGRTGRAGKSGMAISFATPDQHRDVLKIERLLRQPLTRSPYSLEVSPSRSSYGGGASSRSYSRPRPAYGSDSSSSRPAYGSGAGSSSSPRPERSGEWRGAGQRSARPEPAYGRTGAASSSRPQRPGKPTGERTFMFGNHTVSRREMNGSGPSAAATGANKRRYGK